MSSEEEPIGDVDDLEIIEEGEVEQMQNQENVEEINENEDNADGETKTVVKPKRVIKNPQPKLNEQTLKGPKGLAAIESYFERVKFKGRGYEEQDLNVLMKTYEYWCHRLFPKFPFDDCIARLEKLGTKKATQTHIKRIRLDINFDEDKPLLSDEGENDTAGFVDTYSDPFDQLLPTTSTEPTREPVIDMTDEQLERMRQNKERAQRLREERLRKIRDEAANNLASFNQAITQNSQELNTQDTHEAENFHANNTSVNSSYSQIDSAKKTNPNENDNFENRFQKDSEEATDTLELEKLNMVKKKKRVIESDSEDEITENNLGQSNQITQSSQESNTEDSHVDSMQGNIYERPNTRGDGNKHESGQINTQDSHETENFNANGVNGSHSQNKKTNPRQNDKFVSRLRKDSEADMDTLELEEENTTKKKKRTIESDSEDEIIDERNKRNASHNPKSVDDDELDGLITKAKVNHGAADSSNNVLNCSESVATQNDSNGYIYFQDKAPMLLTHEEAEENDIEDILNQINADDTEIEISNQEVNQSMDTTKGTA